MSDFCTKVVKNATIKVGRECMILLVFGGYKMDFRNVVLDAPNSFGELRFKKIMGKTFKYVDGVKTDEFTGFKILVESSFKKDVFEIKILDADVESYKKLAINQDVLYNSLISFNELIFNVNLFKTKLYNNVTAYGFEVHAND